MKEQIDDVFREALGLDENYLLQSDLKPGDMPEWDSYGQIVLMSRLEEVFHIVLSADDMIAMDSYEAVKSIVLEKLVKRND